MRSETSPDDETRFQRYQRLACAPEYTAGDLRALRHDADLTQREFADRVGVSRKAVEMWEMEGRFLPNAVNRLTIYEEFDSE